MPKSLWQTIPEELTVRVLRLSLHVPGFRVHSVTLVTTLLDAQKHPAEELAYVYGERRRVESWFPIAIAAGKVTPKMKALI